MLVLDAGNQHLFAIHLQDSRPATMITPNVWHGYDGLPGSRLFRRQRHRRGQGGMACRSPSRCSSRVTVSMLPLTAATSICSAPTCTTLLPTVIPAAPATPKVTGVGRRPRGLCAAAVVPLTRPRDVSAVPAPAVTSICSLSTCKTWRRYERAQGRGVRGQGRVPAADAAGGGGIDTRRPAADVRAGVVPL